MIWTLSEYQIRYLKSLFMYSDAPDGHAIKVQQIGREDATGDLIVQFLQYGTVQTKRIPLIYEPDKY